MAPSNSIIYFILRFCPCQELNLEETLSPSISYTAPSTWCCTTTKITCVRQATTRIKLSTLLAGLKDRKRRRDNISNTNRREVVIKCKKGSSLTHSLTSIRFFCFRDLIEHPSLTFIFLLRCHIMSLYMLSFLPSLLLPPLSSPTLYYSSFNPVTSLCPCLIPMVMIPIPSE